MSIILIGTNHSKDEEEIGVILDYDKDDTWEFTFGETCISVSDLTLAIKFLKEQKRLRQERQ